jgi:hypothetical protein
LDRVSVISIGLPMARSLDRGRAATLECAWEQ